MSAQNPLSSTPSQTFSNPAQGRPTGHDTILPNADPELQAITVRGAREHNLKNLHLSIPKRSLVVFTGPSGSGKSSLAFDTLFAEGQRRYVESLSAYARQFLGQMDKPDYDSIRGLSPTISIDQKSSSANPRSTVGTITEVYDYMRVLFARIGRQHCDQCNEPVGKMTPDQIVDATLKLPERTKFLLLAPIARNRKGEFKDVFADLMKDGFSRVRIDGELRVLEEGMKLQKQNKHTIDVIVDRLVAKPSARDRIADSVELALRVGQGTCSIETVPDGKETIFSEHLYCHACEKAFRELSPQSFSFNSPLGMCPSCNGLGVVQAMDPDKVVAATSLSLREGAVIPWGPLDGKSSSKIKKPSKTKKKSKKSDSNPSWTWETVIGVCEAHDIDLDTPWKDLSQDKRNVLLYGSNKTFTVTWERGRSSGTLETTFEGILNTLQRRHRETQSENARTHYAQFMTKRACTTCNGKRLSPESGAVRVGDAGITELGALSVQDLQAWFQTLELDGNDAVIGTEVRHEIVSRLQFLLNVGLNYLSLSRPGPTLSGGEMQRIRLASQLGSELSGVLYILDEPSIGLHPRDNTRLIQTLKRLRDCGNSVLVVEHDSETMLAADYIVDFGPGAGVLGGEIVAQGSPKEVMEHPKSLTGQYLSGRANIEVPAERRTGKGGAITVYGARGNNLKNVDASFPLGVFTCVTGVSGAGKSTLVNRILFPAASRAVYPQSTAVPDPHDRIEGLEGINKVIEIDQKPIGRTPRSNPATYTKVFDDIRKVFAALPESKMYGYTASRFSFNLKGGRCEACQGAGQKRIEMHFLADVFVPCEICQGRRFNDATLKVTYRGYSISDLLDMPVEQACPLFKPHPRIHRILQTLVDVGLGYIRLGQPSPTLSGGEAQRIKLARELAKIATGDTLYILDEPSTGLHFDDIRKLLNVVSRLVDAGNTVVMIEHNLDIVKTADFVIDLGPDGGEKGGLIVATGTPEDIAQHPDSLTGSFLAPLLHSAPKPKAKTASKTKPKPKTPSKPKTTKAKPKTTKAKSEDSPKPVRKTRKSAAKSTKKPTSSRTKSANT